MPLSSLISLNVILCEQILEELDHTFSAIRIVDIFYLTRSTSDPAIGEPIRLNVLVMGKTVPSDRSEHSAQLFLIQPDGQQRQMGDALRAVFDARLEDESRLSEESKASDIAGGFSIRAEFTLIPRLVGRYQIAVFIDGELAARVPFTVLELMPD